VEAVGHNTVDYLNKLCALTSASDITAWHTFHKNHPSEKLRGQFSHICSLIMPKFNSFRLIRSRNQLSMVVTWFQQVPLMNSCRLLGSDTSYKSCWNHPCRNQPAYTDWSSAIESNPMVCDFTLNLTIILFAHCEQHKRVGCHSCCIYHCCRPNLHSS
jgi:hypothetical protein